jgi:hypothetical protein
LVVGMVLLVPSVVGAAEMAPAGAWKVSYLVDDARRTLWLLKIESKDGKWTGALTATAKGVGASTLTDFSVKDEVVRFTIKMKVQSGTLILMYEGKVPKGEAQVIRGSLLNQTGQELLLCELEATAVKSLDDFELNKELLAKKPNDPKVFTAALDLLSQAADKKAKPEEVRSWAEKALKAAEPFGVRWQREMAVRVADALAEQDGFDAIALAYAQRAERMLEPRDDAAAKLRVLKSLAAALKKAGKDKEAKEVQARLDKAEKDHKARLEKLEKERLAELEKEEEKADATYLEKMPPFKPETFAGRKAKSERVVLAELFLCAQEPVCVAADLAFLGLLKTYKPTDVVLLQYHVPGRFPDPLATPETGPRMESYGDDVTGTPTIFFSGKAEDVGGGKIENAKKIYGLYRKALEPLLEKPAHVKVTVNAVRKGNKIDIAAEASGIDKPGEDVRLRFVLTDERIRFQGANGIRLHHHVARAMPGGVKGVALKEKTSKHTASVNLDELRKTLAKYLASVEREERTRFPDTQALLAFKDLRVVAFVQNDKTKEVLQAVQVEVKMAKE